MTVQKTLGPELLLFRRYNRFENKTKKCEKTDGIQNRLKYPECDFLKFSLVNCDEIVQYTY